MFCHYATDPSSFPVHAHAPAGMQIEPGEVFYFDWCPNEQGVWHLNQLLPFSITHDYLGGHEVSIKRRLLRTPFQAISLTNNCHCI